MDFTLLLAGTTAGDENSDFAKRLSYDRANAVKNTLVSLGVREERIVTAGLGSGDPWHIYGVGESGDLAAQNRKVVLMSTESDDAALILERL